jgi:micrococcal nuclease
MLSALWGVKGPWGPPLEPLPIEVRLAPDEDLEAFVQHLKALGASDIRPNPKRGTLEARIEAEKLWDLLCLEGVEGLFEARPGPSRRRRALLGAGLALGAALALAGIIWWAVGLSRPPGEKPLARWGEVASVLSGDSLRLASGQLVRLAGIRAPYLGHPRWGDGLFGPEAKQALEELARGKRVELSYPSRPERADGSLLAFAKLEDGRELNALLLEQGAAQVDLETAGPERRRLYLELEASARRDRVGLWAGPVVGNRRTRVYHLPGGLYYNRVSPSNRVLFSSEAEARAAGYRPSSR